MLDDDAETRRYIETLPRRGYRFIAQIEAADSTKPIVPPAGPGPIQPPKPRRWKYAVAVLVALALLAGLLYRLASPNIAQLIRLRQLQQLTVVPLTALPGNVALPTFSPDGSQIAFAWDGENNGAGYDLYVKAIGTEKPLRLTHHPAARLSLHGRPMAVISQYLGLRESSIQESTWFRRRVDRSANSPPEVLKPIPSPSARLVGRQMGDF